MQSSGIHAVQEIFLLLLLFVIVFASLARRLQTPYPIVLVIAGLFLGFVPKIPRITLDPDMVFLAVLPPLLYAAAWQTSWRDFSYNLVSIASLAFGLVGFTVFGVAQAAHWLFSGFDWRLGFVLGAVIAPTDPVAAASIAKRIGLPRRIFAVLEGESLLNDATGLLALQFGISMVVSGQTPTVTSGFLRLLYMTVVGLALGLLLGLVVEWFENRIDDGPIEIAISILVPYAAYLASEAIQASGVLSVVACGLYLGRQSSHFFSPSVRLQVMAVWNSLTFVLNGLVFVLIGLQLPYVRAGIGGYSLGELLLYGGLFSGLVIALRLMWTFPGAYAGYFIRRHVLHQDEERPSHRQVFLVGWTGMRGVIALAAALSLPVSVADGSPFPQRNLIVFLTFSVILVTLVLQGLTLPAVIKGLGLGASGQNGEVQEARRLVLQAALAHLEEIRGKDRSSFTALYGDLAQHYRSRLASISVNGEDGSAAPQRHARYVAIARELLGIERKTAVDLRNEGRINDEVLRQLERELDLNETRMDASVAG